MSQTMKEENVGGMGAPTPMGANGIRADQPFINPNPNAGNTTNMRAATGQQDAPDFLQVIRQTTAATAMSAAGTKYVHDLKEHIKAKCGLMDIKTVTLSYPPETLAVVCGDSAYLLIFSEANRKDENIPTCALTQPAQMTMRSVLGDSVVLRNSIVVTPYDYDKVEAMGAHLVNCFAAGSSTEVRGLNIRSLNRSQLEISPNPDGYDDFTRRVDPMGSASRADIKLLVSLNSPKKNNPANLNMFEQIECDKTEIASIGAYVTFASAQDASGQAKFIPEIHISSLVTNMPFPGMMPILISLATDYLITNQGWKQPFANLGGQGQPNIGNLLVSETGAPWRCENLMQRDSLITQYCVAPVLLLDVTHGRARIPGIEQYAIAESNPMIVESLNRFLIDANIDPHAKVTEMYYQEYTGFLISGGIPMDSRWIDFLNLMVSQSQNRAQCEMLLSHTRRPEDMVAIKRSLCPDLVLHYVTDVVILQPETVRCIQNAVHRHVRTANANTAAGAIDVSIALAASRGFAAGAGTPSYTGSVGSSFAPFYTGGASLF